MSNLFDHYPFAYHFYMRLRDTESMLCFIHKKDFTEQSVDKALRGFSILYIYFL